MYLTKRAMKGYLFLILLSLVFISQGIAQPGGNCYSRQSKNDTIVSHIRCVTKTNKDNGSAGQNCNNASQRPPMKLKVSIFNDTCNSGWGMIIVNMDSIDYPSCHYRWSNGQITSTAVGLTAGTYDVTVTDAKGNSATSSATVQNTGMQVSVVGTVTQPVCAANSGEICVHASGGAGNIYLAVWSTGSAGMCADSLSSGTYSVTVSDQYGCNGNTSFTVNPAPAPISINARVLQPVCSGDSGAIGIEPDGGTGPNYTAHWSNGSTGFDLSKLPPGNYSVTVTDENNCTANQSFEIAEPDSIALQFKVSSVNCDSILPGSISMVSITGAAHPWNITWRGTGNYSSTSTSINDLSAGNYAVSVTDVNGCTASADYTIATTGQIKLSYATTNAICPALHSGSIELNSANPDSSASYNWSGAGGFTSTSAMITNLAAGVYNLNVADKYGCNASLTDTVEYVSLITMQFVMTPVNCDSSIGGRLINTDITGATPPWTVSWNGPDGFVSALLSNEHLSTGNYNMVLTDSNGCVGSANYNITSTGSISTAYVVTNTSCPMVNNGAINRALLDPYSSPSFYWTGPNGFTSDSTSIKGLAAGIYKLLVSEPYGCSASITDTVREGPVVSMQYVATPVKCDSAIGGTLINTGVTGAYYPWKVSWSGPAGFISNSVSLYGLTAGNYAMNFMDAHGCTGAEAFVVDSTGVLDIDYSVTNSNCASNNNGALNYVSLIPYSPLVTYHWEGSNNFSSSSQSITNMGPGNYTLTVEENFGCKVINNYSISACVDVGVVSIKNVNCPAPGKHLIIHPIVGDVSQLNGGHCASGASGQVILTYTGSADFSGCAEGGLVPSVNGNTLTWIINDFGNVNIDSSFFIILNVDSSAIVGSQIGITVQVMADRDDCNAANNTDTFSMMVINSYDPNEKQVFPQGAIDNTQKTLSYTVLFQNTGTGAAQNVAIRDTLDAHVNPSSLRVLASSYPVQALIDGNAVSFDFLNINLPTITSDSSGSQGWVQYSVEPENNLPVGIGITNTAYIYFDLNLPVVTNTTVNLITSPSSTGFNAPTGMQVSATLFPNPAHTDVFVEVEDELVGGRMEIIDALGWHCREADITARRFDVSINNLASGLYSVNITTPTGKPITLKLMVE